MKNNSNYAIIKILILVFSKGEKNGSDVPSFIFFFNFLGGLCDFFY